MNIKKNNTTFINKCQVFFLFYREKEKKINAKKISLKDMRKKTISLTNKCFMDKMTEITHTIVRYKQ